MHYYGTYAMAMCAGVRHDISLAIATAAEYVDDSDYVDVTLGDGERVQGNPTAHHPFNVHNFLFVDQRKTWIPFHFIPGNQGESPFRRLHCGIDSTIANRMVRRNLALATEPFGIALLGITAHVYADTFAHYGFSGITSIENHVVPGSIELDLPNDKQEFLRRSANEFFERYVGDFAKSLIRKSDIAAQIADALSGLGHAGVATYPDQPYLRWRFTYRDTNQQTAWRNNQDTFLLGCRKLHEMFMTFHRITENDYFVENQYRPFEVVEARVRRILATIGDVNERIAQWQIAATAGDLYANAGRLEIPRYDCSSYLNDVAGLATMDPKMARRTEVYDFIRAANSHRDYVNGELLPEFKIEIPTNIFSATSETLRDFFRIQ